MNSAWLGYAFSVRFGSRILRVLHARKPDFSGFLGICLGWSAGGCHAHPDALEDRTRAPFSGTPDACDVFTYREHAVGRAGCAGARLVCKVKRTFAPSALR